MSPFVYEALPTRVVFGFGTFSTIAEEARRLGARRVLLLSTPGQKDMARRAAELLGDIAIGTFSEAAMHTPVEVTARAVEVFEACAADCTLAVGGGSTTGLGKAIAARTGSKQIVVPTTYAGSEMTPILGETEKGIKTIRRAPGLLPDAVVYDVELTLGLPARLSGASGLNAIAHAVEALYARDANPIVSLMAEEAIKSLGEALPRIAEDPGGREARAKALYGACLAGICLGSVGMAIHHKLCHTLGGAFNLPHADTHAVILPHAVAYVAPAAGEAVKRIAGALATLSAPAGLYELAGRVGAPRSLLEIGMPAEGVDLAADLATRNPYWNPRPIEQGAIRALISRAFEGAPPQADADTDAGHAA